MNSRKLVAAVASAVMGLSLVGCGSGSGNGGSKEVLKVGTTQKLSGVFNPMYATTAYDQWVANMVYQPLIGYDADSNLKPIVAAELPEVSEDGKTVTFKLRPDQKFSDGTTLDGDDVKYSVTLMADPDYVGGPADGTLDFVKGFHEYQYGDAKSVEGIQVSDDKLTVTFTLAEPNIDAATSLGTVPIQSNEQFEYTKGNLDAYKNMEPTQVMGSGAYKLNKYDKSAGASVVLNDAYTGVGDYKIKSVVIRTIAAGTEVATLQNGDIDYFPESIEPGIIGPASLVDTLTTDHYFRSAEGYFGFNTQFGPTADQAVRQALSYATNREEFVKAFFTWPKGQASDEVKAVSLGYVPKTFWSPVSQGLGDVVTGKTTLDGLQTYDYDMEKAKQILDEAGWVPGSDGIREKDGQKLTVKFLATEKNSVLEMLIPIINKSWKELGVDLQQTTVDFNTMITTVDPTNAEGKEDWNIFFMAVGYTGLSNTSLNQSEGFTGTIDNPVPGGSNYARIIDEDLNNYLNAGKKTGNPAESIDAYSKAAVRASELAPYLALYGNNMFNIYNKRVQNLKTGPVCNWSQALDGASLDLNAAVKSSQAPVTSEAASSEVSSKE